MSGQPGFSGRVVAWPVSEPRRAGSPSVVTAGVAEYREMGLSRQFAALTTSRSGVSYRLVMRRSFARRLHFASAKRGARLAGRARTVRAWPCKVSCTFPGPDGAANST